MKEIRDEQGQTLEEFLLTYDVSRYARPSVTADVALFTMVERMAGPELAVLLVKRRNHPYIGKYALPGGFVNMDEQLFEGAERELYEETGISGVSLLQFGAFGALDRDPRTRVITVGHYGVAPMGTLAPKAGDDAREAALFTVELQCEAASASAETYRMMLMSDRILTARAQLRYNELGAHTAPAPDPGELASDHGHVLFAALCALDKQPRQRLARLFMLGCNEREEEAVAALDNALCALHQSL